MLSELGLEALPISEPKLPIVLEDAEQQPTQPAAARQAPARPEAGA
jgi:hypothetical protein